MSTVSELLQHCTDAPPPGPPDTLFMDVVLDVRRLSFEFPPGGKAPAVVVGSLRSADVTINDARVALVEFHFERVGKLVFVVPAYGANVTIDSMPLRRPQPIRKRASISFAGHVLHVEVATRRDPSDCTTLVQRPRLRSSCSPGQRANSSRAPRTRSETPASKRTEERHTITSRTAPLELSELLAIKAAAAASFPSRRFGRSSLLVVVGAALFGWLLGYAGTHWVPNLWALVTR